MKKINSNLRPVFASKKIADEIKVTEPKPPLINEQCIVYDYKSDLYVVDYVGYTRTIDKHLQDVHDKDLHDQFTIVKKPEPGL